ncbi:hypothetical protein, partial [Methylobacterium sp. WL116]|uniref:hypothetical protein n=1 Tax=Methylobacterium sp. WL116 TaxID=2603889 RepID=UPI0011C9890C
MLVLLQTARSLGRAMRCPLLAGTALVILAPPRDAGAQPVAGESASVVLDTLTVAGDGVGLSRAAPVGLN